MATQTNGSLLSNSVSTKPIAENRGSGEDKRNSDYKEDIGAAITADELNLLDEAGNEQGEDNINEKKAKLDNTDEDGDALNEGSDLTGKDLDVPGAELDDEDEILDEEDEENNSYSEADQGDR